LPARCWFGQQPIITLVDLINMNKPHKPLRSIAVVLTVIVALLMLTGYVQQPTQLNLIKQQGELVVVTRNSPTTFYVGAEGKAGFEYDLAKLFAEHLGVKLKIVTTQNFSGILPMLKSGQAHIAAAGLSVTESRTQNFNFAPAYQEITQQLIYRRGTKKPKSIADLNGKYTEVVAGSSHSELLKTISETQANVQWQDNYEADVEELLALVWQKELDFTIADSNQVEISQRYYPELRVAFDLSSSQQLAWAMSKSDDVTLLNEATRFFKIIEDNGKLADLKERYFGHIRDFDYVGNRKFIRHIGKRLPTYLDDFKQAAMQYKHDWRMLAAIGYQESHWNPRAISPTGVRGIMMLTRSTAADMGISNRINPRNSIHGGARYYGKIKKRLPKTIQEPDRTWFALAAYNIGLGHVHDARKITKALGKDQDKWVDVKDSLPLLMQKRWYKKTKHGYARGMEALRYVENIRGYYDILVWRTETRKDPSSNLLVKYQPHSSSPSSSRLLKTSTPL